MTGSRDARGLLNFLRAIQISLLVCYGFMKIVGFADCIALWLLIKCTGRSSAVNFRRLSAIAAVPIEEQKKMSVL